MADEPIILKYKPWNFKAPKNALIDMMQRLTDPTFEQPDPENPIDPPKLYGNVEGGHPINVELFNGTFGKVILFDKKRDIQIGEDYAQCNGLIITYVAGIDQDAVNWCVYLSEIVESVIENLSNGKILREKYGIHECKFMKVDAPGVDQKWNPVNVEPNPSKTPKMCISAVTPFILKKGREASVEFTI